MAAKKTKAPKTLEQITIDLKLTISAGGKWKLVVTDPSSDDDSYQGDGVIKDLKNLTEHGAKVSKALCGAALEIVYPVGQYFWKEKIEGRQYTIGVDCSDGHGDTADNNCFQVIDDISLEQVA